MGIWEQLGLDMARRRMVALVGAGGKTSTLYALARQAADSGRTVVVTTTTHILRHPGLPLVEEPTPERLRAALEGHGVVTVGTVFRGDKLSGAGTPEELRRAADVVLVEADGAKRLPLKAPAEYEPVIPPCADAVAAVAGMDAVGQAVGAVCHRPERVCALLGAGAEHVLTPEDVALLLANPQGGRKGVGEAMAFRCVLNKADTPERAAHASAVAGRLAERGIHSAITYYREEERGDYAGSDQGSGRSGHRHGGAAVPGGHTGGHDGGGPAHGGASDGGLLPVHVRRRGPGGGDLRPPGGGRRGGPPGAGAGGGSRALRSGGGHFGGAAL